MLLFFLAIVGLALFGCRVSFRGFREDYLDKDCTTAVNGVFILWVFLRHVQDYVAASGYKLVPILDTGFSVIDGLFAQRIVVLFLFFSGFGVMESLRTKGETYVASVPKRRILTTLLNFDLAVLAFVVVAICLKGWQSLSGLQTLLAFTGWTSVGNSNWYIFDIVLCYAVTYVVCRMTSSLTGRGWGVLGAICACIVVLYFVRGTQTWWYDTLIAYPLGALVSLYRRKVEAWLQRWYWPALILSGVIVVVYKYIPSNLLGFKINISTVAFAVGSLLVLMKVRVHNRILEWLGSHLFPVYIYQRLPMIILVAILGNAFVKDFPYVFVVMSLVLTLGIAVCYRFWQIKLK